MSALKKTLDFTNFVRKVAQNEKISNNEIEVLIKRISIYEYMAPFFPTVIDEERAKYIISYRENEEELGKYLKYLALTDKRKLKNMEKKNMKQDLNMLDQDPMRLCFNPLKSKIQAKHYYGKNLISNIILNETPKIVLDVTYTYNPKSMMESKTNFIQLRDVLNINYTSPNPWDINIAGFNPTEESLNIWKKYINFLNDSNTEDDLLPDFDKRPPHEYIPKDKKAVYISLKSKRIIDGPLDADYYVINFNRDRHSQSKAMAAKANVQAYCLPIQKYVTWQRGPLFLPFVNMVNILKDVHNSNGDWKTALERNISKRYIDPNYSETIRYKHIRKNLEQGKKEFAEIIEMMRNVTA
ncbi:Hypothetical protein SRAE_1000068900 [Strongyloides ratti]|uniref:SAM-dependent MTase TRM10-type domain-containing protein n=1 Tax=Strongyloides ratti TaxID=34506 RepID=A0A090KYA5_STRRB|nr:Hypothetical protein SRAE_1000068900 [Strongyloides ratti]CEF62416.1 Hypothetical protein SRAE_1000068900 [Strongyloides ratti]